MTWAIVGAGLLAGGGCSTKQYRASADKEVYGAIAGKAQAVPDMESHFTIEATNQFSTEGLPHVETVESFLGAAGELERGGAVFTLEQILLTAVQNSRVYQNNREQLYLSALAFTLARHQFRPIFSGGGAANYAVQTERFVRYEIDEITGEPKPVYSDRLVETSQINANASVGVSWLIRDIGRITAAFSTDFLRFLTGDPRSVANSQVNATFSRPLLRNAGFKAEIESLTQSERTLLYQVREFVRFRKNFSVDIARDYYTVLGNRDAARNAYLRLASARRAAERSRALAEEGRTTQSDLGRYGQDELSAESDWINALLTYRRALDDFKIKLGVPVETNLVLDDRELADLKIRHPKISVEDSIRVAFEARLDYQNQRDQFEDARRKVTLAVSSLKPQVDLSASGSLSSPPNQTSGFPVPDPERYRWNAGLLVDLPLERTAERNAYRQALISQEQAARALAQRRDEIELEVRESWRSLEQAKRTYEINEIGVRLAERRVEEQDLLADLGRAKAQDQVDAQTALLNSRNQLTQSLVGHTIARLQFWNNMGILYIKDNGQWEEVEHDR